MNSRFLKNILKEKLSLIWQHLNSKELDNISHNIISYSKKNSISLDTILEFKYFLPFCIQYINSNIESRKLFEDKLDSLKTDFFKSDDKKEKNKILLKYSNGIIKKNLFFYISDRKLLKILDIEALTEKYHTKIQIYNKRNAAVCRLLKSLLQNSSNIPSLPKNFVNDFFTVIFTELRINTPDIVKSEMIYAITAILENLNNPKELLAPFKKELIELENSKYTWLKCACLKLNILNTSSNFELFKTVLETSDDIFIREFTVNLTIENSSCLKSDEITKLINIILKDKSPFVRQALAFHAHKLPKELYKKAFEFFLFEENEISVKCSALKIFTEPIKDKTGLEYIFENIRKSLSNINNTNYIKYALHAVDNLVMHTHDYKQAPAFIDIIDSVICSNNEIDIPTKRFAANIREKLYCYLDNKSFRLLIKIKDKIKLNKTKKVINFSPKEFEGYNDETIGRVLSIIAQNSFSLDLKKGIYSYKLFINSSLCFRWWRFLHELRSPSPEKRQTIKHTTGRLFKGTIRASSGIMAEQSETKIPGEPLFINEEGNARPYLPLLDEFISASEYGKEVKFYTSEGITSVIPPKGFLKRFMAEFKIAFNYKKLAKLRNWQQENSQESPASYIESMRKLGFSIKIIPFLKNKTNNIDKDVSKFFLPAMVPIGLIHVLNSLKIYFLSLYENTVSQLAIFVVLLFCFITGRHYLFNILIHKARKSIPLVIGGWGTRGKSGTERIKAALFSALGCNVVSKTTGCEAMFLYTPSFGKTHELFLFRPYDKATIWEQFNLLRTASKLDADVFLWECMALSPPYVKVLQHDWMRDDYSTITNTYPDHEDLQGPAGWNIADTMTNFIPKNSVVFTSEEQMFPILEVGAVKKNTDFFTIDKFNTILLTPDILERFPYEEHPYNITLVLRMASYLGISRQFALKEMADNVVPDIGVLKRYKDADVNGRNLEFFSGMSANERFGCMGNWERMKFDKYNLDDNPDIYVATVVNNRADRIARSKVFAQILVEDINVDKHFLIGNNLEGLGGYIKECWDSKMESFSLASVPDKQISSNEIFTKFAIKLRIPINEEQLIKYLSVLLCDDQNKDNSLKYWNDISKLSASVKIQNENKKTDILKFYKEKLNTYNKFIEFSNKLTSSPNKSLEEECKSFFWDTFKNKIVTVSNYYASGNEIIKTISESSPPNFNVKIMALQNIKGTGLDFFYRWQAWENFYKLCEALNSENEKIVEEALAAIAAFKELDILWIEKLKTSINTLKTKNNNNFTTLIENIESTLNSISLDSFTSVKKKEGGKFHKILLTSLENFLDPGDAVKRRKQADRIYKHLAAGRISSTIAIKELQSLTKRQKGGWLKNKKKLVIFRNKDTN